ncbi:glycosyl hydrolase family 18 protein [Bacillus sp. 31A1R]|uniref:Glycosyl hydrolase family 18 protein n=1 Tax=Robertmurraya mangrovi TaxID=3098077 RepID=A0ABU5IZZ2_9BACI|nr:glycosyl hydrolase family 18 protein [Bacillus sp. 31A1R]MDZ5472733.1 glycosyl hydrolase family 18 protein [Bacillus sp. 31A1R]
MARVEYHKRSSLSKYWIIGGLLFSFLLISSSVILLLYPFASKEKHVYFEGENPILLNGEQQGNAMIKEDSVYVPFTFMKTFIDDSLAFDEKSNSVIITTKDKVVQMPSDSLTFYVNEKSVQLNLSPIQNENGELFVAIDPILSYYPIEYTILKDSNAVWIKTNGQELQHGTVTEEKVHEEKLRLRTDSNLKASYTAQLQNKEKVFIENEKEDYYFVRKEDGTAGYVNKEFVTKGEVEEIVVEHEQKEVALPKLDGPIQLTWEAVYTKNPDTSSIPKMDGVNVVSPTWFELSDKKGGIKNLGSLDYVNWAHKQGYQVWALFSNAFDPELTHHAFKDFKTRQKMIRQLLHYSQMYKLDGINIDIENVNVEDGSLITQFVREATPYFHEAGLIVSMDVTFISDSGNWSAFYEREKLAKVVDYMAVMAYDEHWGSSPVAGSVASLPWVENNLKRMLEVVPNEKLILGVPLYTRLWEVKDSGEISSKAVSMNFIKQWITENKVDVVYDETSGQNYGEHYVKKEKTTYKVWLEDELSLKKRADLAKEYELAGVASWSRFFADHTAWVALDLGKKQLTKKD